MKKECVQTTLSQLQWDNRTVYLCCHHVVMLRTDFCISWSSDLWMFYRKSLIPKQTEVKMEGCVVLRQKVTTVTDLKNTELLWGYWGQWTAPSAGDALLWFFIYLFHLDTFHKRLKLWTRLLFADLSTSNTRQPHILTEELKACFHFNSLWIIDFLSNRSQRVLVNNILSDTIPPLAPHKAVSFLLFCSSFTPRTADPQPNCRLVRFTEDTVLLSLLSGPTQHHGSALQEFVGWCESCCLSLEL